MLFTDDYKFDQEYDRLEIAHPEVEMDCYETIRDNSEKQYTQGCKSRNRCSYDYDGYIDYDDEY